MKKILVTLSLIFVLFSVPPVAHAAAMLFEAQRESVQIGETFAVRVLLATDNKRINAVEGAIQFSQESLELREIRDGGSLVNLWVRKPAVQSAGVVFGGVIPGGYVGDAGNLFTLVFRARQSGRATIQSTNERFLLNDGKGTRAPIRRAPLTVRIGENVTDTDYAAIFDVTPPESFTLAVSRNQDIFDGKWFVAFASDDKGAGLDHYEVSESKGWLQPEVKEWRVAESPYLLADQERRDWIFVKAVDKRGNETVAFVKPHWPFLYISLIVGASAAVLGAAALRLRAVARRKRRRRK